MREVLLKVPRRAVEDVLAEAIVRQAPAPG